MGCCKSKNINYVNELINQIADFEKYIMVIDKNNKTFSPINSLIFKKDKELTRKLFVFFYKLLNFNLIDAHKENKLKFIYFINANNIYFNNQTSDFVLAIDPYENEDYLIRRETNSRENYIYVHPLIKLQIRFNKETKFSEMKEIKKNKYLSWSIGIFLLIKLYEVDDDEIIKFYTNCLSNEKIIDFDVLNYVDKSKVTIPELDLINHLINYEDSKQSNILIDLENLMKYFKKK
jgi:hypothetical protein